MAVGGGDLGKVVGTVPATMIETGYIMLTRRLSTDIFPRNGDTITGNIAGKKTSGIIDSFLIMIYSTIGTIGNRIGIGNVKDGEYKKTFPSILKGKSVLSRNQNLRDRFVSSISSP